MKRFAPLALIALLGACETMDGGYGREPAGPGPFPDGPPSSGPYDPNRPDSAPYRAIGTEPFWSLDIDSREMRFSQANDGRDIVEPTPRVIHGFAGDIYQGQRIRVNIVHGQCSDGMSDRTYPDKVQVGVDGKQYEGCGGLPTGGEVAGPLPPPQSGPATPLADSMWRVVAINGRPTPNEPKYRMEFTGDRVSAGFGCNGMGGSYVLDRDMLSVGSWMGTQMACGEPAMGFESQGSAVLRIPARARFAPGRLTLTNNAGTIELARR